MIVKDVLWAGRWKYPDGTILSVDTNALDRACRNGNAMIQDGYDIKICAEHQPSAFPKTNTQWMSEISTPEKKAEFVRSIFGDAVAFTRGKNEAGRESVFAHIDDSKMSEEARRTIQAVGKVSCRLDYDLKELSEGGRKYPGLCISHIAVTPRPVNPRQGAFLMSSLSVSGNPVWNCGKTFFMAEEGVKEMKEDEDDDQGDDGDDYIPREPVIETSEAPTPAAQPTAASAISDGQDFQRLLAAMNKGWGFVPTDGVTDLKTLTIAIERLRQTARRSNPPAIQANNNSSLPVKMRSRRKVAGLVALVPA
jgi:hypothetical protein